MVIRFWIARLKDDTQAIKLLKRGRVRLFHQIYPAIREDEIRLYLVRLKAKGDDQVIRFGYVPSTHTKQILDLSRRHIPFHWKIHSINSQLVCVELQY